MSCIIVALVEAGSECPADNHVLGFLLDGVNQGYRPKKGVTYKTATADSKLDDVGLDKDQLESVVSILSRRLWAYFDREEIDRMTMGDIACKELKYKCSKSEQFGIGNQECPTDLSSVKQHKMDLIPFGTGAVIRTPHTMSVPQINFKRKLITLVKE